MNQEDFTSEETSNQSKARDQGCWPWTDLVSITNAERT